MMKESVLDVLMYLFEHYLDEDDVDVESDRESLRQELAEAGFQDVKIAQAFDWLEGLATEEVASVDENARHTHSVRVYCVDEMERLDVECRGFLLFLEQVGVVDPMTREVIIDRVMALETGEIDMEQLKWVVLMVLFNQPAQESMFTWMEDFVLDRECGRLH